ncbi:MAG: O-antigen ligase family protein [Elusimicrobia bacterium]|nr:O-antigen ligase family protein [Elusimicrobiota bacterium]
MAATLGSALLAACFFACPLLFFTNLTRNPYVAQIVLLNVCLAAASALCIHEALSQGRPWRPRSPLDLPWLGWLAACLVSWAVSYWGRTPFFRPAIAAEGSRAFLFLGVNCFLPFLLALHRVKAEDWSAPVSAGAWAWFILGWGLAWMGFPALRRPGGGAVDFIGNFWDPYGALLWALGLAGACRLCRKGRAIDFLHLALGTAFLASAYGVLQYFNIEWIWPNVLNPYGGRSVSTFGNPNFMSSFNVVLFPSAAVLFLLSNASRRWIYATLLLTMEAGLLCSLTRSSWLGALAGLAALLAAPELRRQLRQNPRPQGLMLALGLALALLWPHSSIKSGYTPTVIGRLAEIGQAAQARTIYGPWHQRLLIWTASWSMGAENPATGAGYGLFELFYPFYQGPLVEALEVFRGLRTHANNSHNEILEVWAQTGVLGLGVWLWFWTAFFTPMLKAAKNAPRSFLLPLAAAAGAFGMLADNLLNVSLHFPVPAFVFWWCAGAALASLPGRQEDARQPRRWSGVAVGLASAALVAGIAWHWTKVFNREWRYFSGFKLLRHSALAQASQQLEKARDWGPPEVNSLYELGNSYARAQRFQEARKAYAAALQANAGYDEIYYNIGVIEAAHLGSPRQAIPFLEAALCINPLSAEAHNQLQNIYLGDPQSHAERAEALLKRALALHPGNPSHWNNLGFLRALSSDYPAAERAYAQALRLDPNFSAAERNLLALARQSGRPIHPIVERLPLLRRQLQNPPRIPPGNPVINQQR